MSYERRVISRDIVAFIVEFTRKIGRINEDLVRNSAYFLHFGNRRVYLNAIWKKIPREITPKDCFSILESEDCFEHAEGDVKEAAGDNDCIAWLCCDGDLYEKIQGYYRRNKKVCEFGDEAEKLISCFSANCREIRAVF